MRAQPTAFVEVFAPARQAFNDLLAALETPDVLECTHSVVEESLRTQGFEVLRLLYQGFFDRCALVEQRRVEAQTAPTEDAVELVPRPLESLFGRVLVRRSAVLTGAGERPHFPLDQALNLPREVYSLPVRQRVAESARSVAMAPTVESVDRTTGAHVPKRQVEELVVRAAQDFDAFYAQRTTPANDTLSDEALLVLTSDSKGIAMLPKALRPATRAKAQAAKAEQPTHVDPMKPKGLRTHNKRMALVTAVYAIEPHVRTAEDVVQGLSRTIGAPVAAPRPQNKTVSATVVKSQKDGIHAMFDEAERRDPTHRRRTVVLVDGEAKQLEKIEREAKTRAWVLVVILDLLHVLHYVWAAVSALCDKATAACAMDEALRLLLLGDSKNLARMLALQATKHGLSTRERKPVERCVKYLRKYAKYLRYDVYLAAGYPIATGVIEGACRHLVQDRMGITGARWDLPGAEAVLRLRALWTNGDWKEYWTFHEQREALRNAPKKAA